jgi:hypothetical protein
MGNRPPLRTNEIRAYNWGARGRAAGLLPGDLEPMGSFPPRLGLSPGELDALAGLGVEHFQRWALKGWIEAPEPGRAP